LEPDILIVDEALAVGDALFQKRCFQQIEKLTSNGVTLLFVSHDQESVRTLTNRAILLDRGTQLSTGLSSEVLLEYRRLLHREESKYFSQLAEEVAAHADATRDINQPPTAPAKIEISANAETPAVEETSPSRTDKLSFGEGEAEVENVELFTASGER
ncbi:ABC transporter ATP-binding protein, partial [Klebsiella pneumoniae]|nr:ABC transporter ATP-binding protein [Klebsiella pneumoniae]